MLLTALEEALNCAVIERETEIHATMLALLARKHIFMLGPPGTAKSKLAKLACQAIGGSFFETLLTRTSPVETLVGPISLKGLEVDEFRRITKGTIVDADIIFLDEIWKCSAAVLHTLLPFLFAREYHEQGTAHPVPLQTMVCASNEMPDGGELAAVYDRIHFRFKVGRLSSRDALLQMLHQPTKAPTMPKVTLQALTKLQGSVATQDVDDDTFNCLADIEHRLRMEGITPSPRRFHECVPIVQAEAVMKGLKVADRTCLEPLKDVLWELPEQRKKVTQVVLGISVPHLARIAELLDEAEDVYEKAAKVKEASTQDEGTAKMRTIMRELRKCEGHEKAYAKIDAWRNELARRAFQKAGLA